MVCIQKFNFNFNCINFAEKGTEKGTKIALDKVKQLIAEMNSKDENNFSFENRDNASLKEKITTLQQDITRIQFQKVFEQLKIISPISERFEVESQISYHLLSREKHELVNLQFVESQLKLKKERMVRNKSLSMKHLSVLCETEEALKTKQSYCAEQIEFYSNKVKQKQAQRDATRADYETLASCVNDLMNSEEIYLKELIQQNDRFCKDRITYIEGHYRENLNVYQRTLDERENLFQDECQSDLKSFFNAHRDYVQEIGIINKEELDQKEKLIISQLTHVKKEYVKQLATIQQNLNNRLNQYQTSKEQFLREFEDRLENYKQRLTQIYRGRNDQLHQLTNDQLNSVQQQSTQEFNLAFQEEKTNEETFQIATQTTLDNLTKETTNYDQQIKQTREGQIEKIERILDDYYRYVNEGQFRIRHSSGRWLFESGIRDSGDPYVQTSDRGVGYMNRSKWKLHQLNNGRFSIKHADSGKWMFEATTGIPPRRLTYEFGEDYPGQAVETGTSSKHNHQGRSVWALHSLGGNHYAFQHGSGRWMFESESRSSDGDHYVGTDNQNDSWEIIRIEH